jgi:isonocardicin synthase
VDDACLAALAAEVSARRPRRLFEQLSDKPYDLFVARTGHLRWAGRKRPAPVVPGLEAIKSCLVTAEMIEGLLDQVQVGAAGVTVYLRPLDDAQRAAAFAALTSSPLNDIQFPFGRLSPDGLTEPVSPPDYWTPTPERVRELDLAETPLRHHAVGVLRRHGIGGGRVFDPACSTGAFLAHLGRHLPGTWTIGQDLSAPMIDFARGRVDEARCGDSIRPAVAPGSVDVLVLRHLNVDVVTTEYAHALFDACVRCVTPRGLVLVTGHTPVLIASAYFEQAGLTIVERLGVTPGGGAVFPFYVLRNEPGAGGSRNQR